MQWLRKTFRQNSVAENAFAVFAMASGAVIALSLLFGMLGLSGLLSDVVAAWVQAVGSIAAIVASAWISFQAVDRGHRRAETRQRELVQAVADAAMFTVDVIDAALHEDDPRAGVWRVYARVVIDDLMESLRQVPVTHAATAAGVHAFTRFRMHLPLMADALDAFMTRSGNDEATNRIMDQYRAARDWDKLKHLQDTIDGVMRSNVQIQVAELRKHYHEIRRL